MSVIARAQDAGPGGVPLAGNSGKTLAALILLGMTSSASGTIGPLMLGLYIDARGMSAQNAGFVLAIEASGYVIAQILFSWRLYAWNRKAVAAASVLAVVAANLVTAYATGFLSLASCRLLAGLGMGGGYAILTSSIATRINPSRDYAIFAATNLLYASVLFAGAAPVVAKYGLAGITVMMAAIGALGFLSLGSILASPAVEEGGPQTSGWLSLWRSATGRAIIQLSLTLMVLYAGHNALWSYQERMGLAAGLSPQSVGLLLGLSILCGSIGAIGAAFVGTRFGFLRPQALALVTVITAGLLLAHGSGPTVYVFAAILVKIGWFFGVPLLQGALARLDPSGRTLVAAGALQTIGSTIGPAAAAVVVPHGYLFVGWTAIAFYLLCIPAFGVFCKLDRGRFDAIRSPISTTRPAA